MENKKNTKLHFIYVSIILSLIVIELLSMIVYQKDSAWLFIGFAGTTLSVVLSILAIFVTFIDIAGQQKKLSDITETANELKFSLNQFIKESQKFYDNTNSNLDSNNIKTEKESTPRYSTETVGVVGKIKVKKYDISIKDITAFAEATKVKFRVIDEKDLYWYTIEYSGMKKDQADTKKFLELIKENATIID